MEGVTICVGFLFEVEFESRGNVVSRTFWIWERVWRRDLWRYVSWIDDCSKIASCFERVMRDVARFETVEFVVCDDVDEEVDIGWFSATLKSAREPSDCAPSWERESERSVSGVVCVDDAS